MYSAYSEGHNSCYLVLFSPSFSFFASVQSHVCAKTRCIGRSGGAIESHVLSRHNVSAADVSGQSEDASFPSSLSGNKMACLDGFGQSYGNYFA